MDPLEHPRCLAGDELDEDEPGEDVDEDVDEDEDDDEDDEGPLVY
jgi:hypothetical protein